MPLISQNIRSTFKKLPMHLKTLTYMLCAFLVSLRPVRSFEVPVCCPPDHFLVDVNQGYFHSEKYECKPSNSSKVVEINWEFVKAGIVYGFHIKQVNVSSIPICDNQVLTKFTEDTYLTPSSCLIKLYETIYAISCPLRTNERVQKVSMIRKCCPFGYVYESKMRKCTLEPVVPDYYKVMFTHPMVVIDDPLTCKTSQVMVEYKLRYDEFQLRDNYLILKLAKQRFEGDEFCIEGIHNENKLIGESKVTNVQDQYRFLIRICEDDITCAIIPCIRKCCEDGDIYVRGNNTSHCVRDSSDVSFHSFESLEFRGNFSKPSVFGVLRGLNCKKYKLNPDPDYADDYHSISDEDGSVFLPFLQKTFDNTNYCVEKIRKASTGIQTLETFLCFEDVAKEIIKFSLYSVGLLISCVFYALTLVVYLFIPKLKNLPGKILICLVSSLFLAYLGIAIAQITPPNDNVCSVYAFCVYFSLMAAFAWMNVMCFDIWQTFGSADAAQGLNRGQSAKFIYYSLYGWGTPTILTIITICLTKFDLLSVHLRPKFGKGRCWFQYTLAASQLLFFSGPVGILFLVNFILFILTLRYCNKVKREIFRMQNSNVAKPVLRKRFFIDKARFMMNTKLFIVMGITWFLEILSTIFYNRKRTFIWVISDSFNVLLGVSVFFIFVFKRRIWEEILVRLGVKTRENMRSGLATYATNSTYGGNVNLHRIKNKEGNSTLLHPSSAALRRLS